MGAVALILKIASFNQATEKDSKGLFFVWVIKKKEILTLMAL